MKVHPIIFQPEMVRALIRTVEKKPGAKTQTRRLRWLTSKKTGKTRENPLARCEPGDVLYVRENWQTELRWHDFKPSELPKAAPFYFSTEPEVGCAGRLRPSIHLPRRGSRLTLAVTEVRFERLRDISEADAQAEGAEPVDPATGRKVLLDPEMGSHRYHFREIWRQINGEASWDENPEVVALTFTVHRQNVDEFLRAGASNG